MGGIDGSRGYVYQGIAAVLEAISDDSWDRIYIELPTDGDKVDIALSHNGTIIKTIQVKSTDNTFTPGEIKQWIKDLANDYPCTCYELVLIGHASSSARDLINAIKKYKDGQLDKTADDALRGFDTTIFDDARVQVRTLQNDKSALLAIVRDSLAKYVEGKYLPMQEMCAKALPNETGGVLIGRYSEDCRWAEITGITSAPAGSTHHRYSFVRAQGKLLTLLDSLWKKNEYYIGEWHFHPEALPSPSSTDVNTMHMLSKNSKLHCPEPILIIIGGNEKCWSYHVSVFSNGEQTGLNLI